MCPNNNSCLALGEYTTMSNAYFDDMNFKYAVNPITAVGSNSTNGFIRRIVHTKNEYSTITMLKSPKSNFSDNLMYEYLVGLFINKYNSMFPCFLQTYACYQYKNEEHYAKFSENTQTTDDLNELIPLYSYKQKSNQQTVSTLVTQSCDQSKYICISIQYFEDPVSLEDLLGLLYNNKYFCIVELIQLLLQIYIPLGIMANEFTHNDLHSNNVLIYTIPDGQYITMKYTTPFGNVTFKTQYVCKIIDYGRCYFKDNRMSSEKIREDLCKNPKCGEKCKDTDICHNGLNDSNCGIDAGYNFVDTYVAASNYNMSAIKNNPGKDLWLMQIIKNNHVKYMSRRTSNANVTELINSVMGNKINYGLLPSFSETHPGKILNVVEFMKKAIICFNKILPNIDELQLTELSGISNYGTIEIDAITNGDYTFSKNY